MTVPVVESWVRAERLTWLDGDLLMAVAPITAGVQVWGCGCDDQITTAAKRRTYVRDDLGRFDDVPGGGGVSADKLRLQRWAPVGFTVRSSKKVKNENSDLGIAEVDGPDGPQIRIGAVDPDSGKWDAGFSGEARMAALREQIEQKQDDFDNESDHDQAVALEDEIGELESELETLDQDRTAVLTPAAMADFRRRLGEASTLARSNKAEQDSALRAYEALDKQRADIIAEFSDTELEEEISQAQGHLWARNYRLRLVRGDSKYARYIPEAEADAAEAERDLAPLLVERAELMPPGPRVQLEELERRQGALNADDIDGIITSAEISSADGMRVLAEVWGSDDVDDDWVTTRFYVLAPGESTDDADDQGRDAQFRGLKGLNKLIAGLEPVDGPTVAAAVWGCGCPTTAGKDVIVRDGHTITVNRDGQGQFAEKAGVDLSKLKVPELRKLATERGLKGLSKATKPQLVEALNASDDPVKTTAKSPSRKMKPSTPAQGAAERSQLRELHKKAPTSTRDFEKQGIGGQTTVLMWGDGSKAVHKRYGQDREWIRDPREMADAEELGALVGHAVGARVPAVIRTGPNRIRMQHVNGDPGHVAKPDLSLADLPGSEDGRLIGLLDVLIANPDRSYAKNWMLGADGKVWGIDHGSAFGAASPEYGHNPWADHFLIGDTIGIDPPPQPENDMSPSDMALIRKRLEALKPAFAELGRGDWHEAMMQRLDMVESQARGTKSRLS